MNVNHGIIFELVQKYRPIHSVSIEGNGMFGTFNDPWIRCPTILDKKLHQTFVVNN